MSGARAMNGAPLHWMRGGPALAGPRESRLHRVDVPEHLKEYGLTSTTVATKVELCREVGVLLEAVALAQLTSKTRNRVR